MFYAREKYAKENKIPRNEIQRWGEWRMIIFLTSFLSILSLTVSVLTYLGFDEPIWFISSLFIGGVLNPNGTLKNA